jgi:hypothetical protein
VSRFGGPADAAANAAESGAKAHAYKVMFDAQGKKLLLPEPPAHDDPAGCCAWLTVVFNLTPRHPITRGERKGAAGPDGHVALHRADAPTIWFEPASKINTPAKLIDALSWYALPTDGMIHALKADHCREITYVVRMLCGRSALLAAEDEAAGIVGTFLAEAEPVDGHTTYGTSAQRYEAAVALRREIDSMIGRPTGPRRYLIDVNTGELVIAVGDLQDAARRHVGSSMAHGWLDARMEASGFTRVELQGYGQPAGPHVVAPKPERVGRRGRHARICAYRGHHARSQDEQEAA